MNCSTPGFPVHHQLTELAQTHVHEIMCINRIRRTSWVDSTGGTKTTLVRPSVFLDWMEHRTEECLALQTNIPWRYRLRVLGMLEVLSFHDSVWSRHCFANKGPSSQGYGFSSSHVWMWELDYKEGWVLKNWCFWTGVMEKTLESPLDCKESQPVHPKGNQSWIFIGRTDIEAETPILWPPYAKSWFIWKDPDAGKDWRQEEKGMTEDEMVGWHHRLNGCEFEWTPGVGDGQGGLACCSPCGRKESDMTE